MSEILVVTTPDVPGRHVDRVIGLVRGTTVRARQIGKDIRWKNGHFVVAQIEPRQ